MSEKSEKKEKKAEDDDAKLGWRFKLLRIWERCIYRFVCPYTLHGNLKKYNDGGVVMIGNHYSYMDVIFPCMLTDKPVRYVAKKELWDNGGFMAKFVQFAHCIPAKRDGSDVQTVKECLRILKNGGVLNIFPEGTRNHSYKELLPFRSGAAALSIKTQTPIVPIVKITKIGIFKRTHVVVGDPIEFRQYYGKRVTKEQLAECDEILRESMTNMRLAFIEKYNIKIKSDKI